MQSNNSTPIWGEAKDVEAHEMEVEVIEKEDDGASIYKPRFTKSVAKAVSAGNTLPVLAVVAARDGTKEDYEEKVTHYKITDCLKKEMAAPTAYFPGASTTAEAISKVLINKALSGDLNSIREVLNRTEGRVPSRTENMNATMRVNTDANGLAALMNKIDQNKG